ncbi:MAG: hypothetical protein OEV56_06325 [Dehalococcoidia bacterium]|nr:hypothetical protein [Dehalococcoidia bacterium]
MALPIRTEIITNLAGVIATEIPEIHTVRLFANPPTDIVGVELPALYLLEIQAEDRQYSNRVAVGTMHFMAQIFVSTTIRDSRETGFVDTFALFDTLAAQLHRVFHTSVGLSKNGLVNIREIQYDRLITTDSVGVLTATFDVEYRHDRGNAFS